VRLDPFGKQVLVPIFLYFNFKHKTVFTNNVGHLWFPFRKKSWKKFLPSNSSVVNTVSGGDITDLGHFVRLPMS
jgi:hypothetical protein